MYYRELRLKVVQVHVRVRGSSTEWQQYRVSSGSYQNGWSSFNSGTRKVGLIKSLSTRTFILDCRVMCSSYLLEDIYGCEHFCEFLFLSFVSTRGWLLSVPGLGLEPLWSRNWSQKIDIAKTEALNNQHQQDLLVLWLSKYFLFRVLVFSFCFLAIWILKCIYLWGIFKRNTVHILLIGSVKFENQTGKNSQKTLWNLKE